MERIIKMIIWSVAGFASLAFFFVLDGICFKHKITSTPGPVMVAGLVITILTMVICNLVKIKSADRKRIAAIKEIAEKEGLSYSEIFDENDPFWSENEHWPDRHNGLLESLTMPTSYLGAVASNIDTTEIMDRVNGLAVKYSMKNTEAYISNVVGFDSENISFRVFDRTIVIGTYLEKGFRRKILKGVSAAIIKFGNLVMPEFWLCPETLATRIADRMTGADIDFEEAPFFSEQYRLTSTDVKVHKVFTPQVLACFEKHTGLTVESDGNRLYVFNEKNAKTPEQVKDFFYAVRDIAFTIYRFSGK